MPRTPTLNDLRAYAAARSFTLYDTVEAAVRAQGFVQADPIRAPARAQDLILRHRVRGYHAGDLESLYPTLSLNEEIVHNHGYVAKEITALLHPRPLGKHWSAFHARHPGLRRAVLAFVRENGPSHPREVEQAVGSARSLNAWGATSTASTMTLEALHRVGLLRVVSRQQGQRVYELAPARGRAPSGITRAEGLARLIATLYAPMPERSLKQALNMVRGPINPHPRDGLSRLVERGEFRREVIEGQPWIWPTAEPLDWPIEERVRLLAPFDPVVWDRRRFELLWSWEYRFEAYTPVAKRKLGYYALPLLFRDQVIGWANVQKAGSSLNVDLGFVKSKPRSAAFRNALEKEIEGMREFLGPVVRHRGLREMPYRGW